MYVGNGGNGKGGVKNEHGVGQLMWQSIDFFKHRNELGE